MMMSKVACALFVALFSANACAQSPHRAQIAFYPSANSIQIVSAYITVQQGNNYPVQVQRLPNGGMHLIFDRTQIERINRGTLYLIFNGPRRTDRSLGSFSVSLDVPEMNTDFQDALVFNASMRTSCTSSAINNSLSNDRFEYLSRVIIASQLLDDDIASPCAENGVSVRKLKEWRLSSAARFAQMSGYAVR